MSIHTQNFSIAISTKGTHQDLFPILKHIETKYSIVDKLYGNTDDIAWVRAQSRSKAGLQLSGLLSVASKASGISAIEIFNWKIRERNIVKARAIVCYMLYKTYKLSYQKIAALVGCKNRETIFEYCKKFGNCNIDNISAETAYALCEQRYDR